MNHLQIGPENTMPLMTPLAVAQWVRTQRKRRQMTQSGLAKKAKVTQRLISEFESGKSGIQLETLCRIFEALEMRFAAVDLKAEIEDGEELEW